MHCMIVLRCYLCRVLSSLSKLGYKSCVPSVPRTLSLPLLGTNVTLKTCVRLQRRVGQTSLLSCYVVALTTRYYPTVNQLLSWSRSNQHDIRNGMLGVSDVFFLNVYLLKFLTAGAGIGLHRVCLLVLAGKLDWAASLLGGRQGVPTLFVFGYARWKHVWNS